MKLKVKPEGREDIYIPTDIENLKDFIKDRELEKIHNFVPSGNMMLGADHEVESVLEDIDEAERLAVLTDPNQNMGHSLSLIIENRLECYDIGEVKKDDLKLTKQNND